MSNRQRYLVIGSGSIARRHIANLKRIFEACEVACVSASGRPLTEDETGATRVFDNLASAIDWKPTFGIVASPAPFHASNAAALLEHGIPVLIEKPLSDALEHFSGNAEVLSRHREWIEVGYNLRYLSSAVRFKELLDGGTVGRIHSVLIDMGQYLPDWRPGTDYRANVSARKELGGGVLLELSHEFDYLTWLFGKFDEAYCVISRSGMLEIDVEDKADIMFFRDDGMVAQLHMDFLQRKATRNCKVIGEHGNLVWDLIANSISLHTGQATECLFDESHVDRNDMYINQLRRFALVAAGKATPLVGLDDALYTLKLIEALRHSSAERQPVSLREF